MTSLLAMRWSTIPFKSRWSLLPKWSNMVDPPLRTMFEYSPRRASIGDVWITWSTTSGSGVRKSDE